jgi:predicted dehydrogenase
MEKTIKIGIIGTGIHGSRYARHIMNDVPGLELAAISRRSDEGVGQAKEWGAALCRDWQDLVKNPGVDAVIAVTTPNLNTEIAEACAGEKKPLLVEKPLAVDAVKAQRMVDLFKQADLPLTVAQTLRYNSIILALKKELARIGRLHAFHACHRLESTRHAWLDNPDVAGGGVIFHTGVHVFDALRFISGREVKRVRASVFQRHTNRLEDLFTAQLEMTGDLVGTMDLCKLTRSRSGRYEFVGEAGQIHGDQVHGFLQLVETKAITPMPVESPASTLIPLLSDWHAFLTGKGENPIPGEDGVSAVKICDACRKSALEDQWVDVQA